MAGLAYVLLSRMSSKEQEKSGAAGERKCATCGVAKGIEAFSGKQWSSKAHSRKCKECIGNPVDVAPASADKDKKPATAAKTTDKKATAKAKAQAKPVVAKKEESKEDKPEKMDPSRMLMRYEKLADMLQQNGASACTSEDDPFICDITGALIDMTKDGRYHFDDGRPPDDDTAVCMSVSAYAIFADLKAHHPETWEAAYADKSKWHFIPPFSA